MLHAVLVISNIAGGMAIGFGILGFILWVFGDNGDRIELIGKALLWTALASLVIWITSCAVYYGFKGSAEYEAVHGTLK